MPGKPQGAIHHRQGRARLDYVRLDGEGLKLISCAVNGEALGLTIVGLGGGRRIETDKIDPSVGITEFAPLGTKFARGDRICQVHARSDAAAQEAEAAILAAIRIGDKPTTRPLVREVIG